MSEINLERTLIKHLITAALDQIILRSTVDMSHQLGYGITAEEVADQAALDYLTSIGGDHAPDYCVFNPVSAADLLLNLDTCEG